MDVGVAEGHEFFCKPCLTGFSPRIGRHGGGSGAPTTITRDDGTVMRGKGKQFIAHGHYVEMAFPGAGYGQPEERDRIFVRRDLAYGYITAEQAAEIYGLSETDISEILQLSETGADF